MSNVIQTRKQMKKNLCIDKSSKQSRAQDVSTLKSEKELSRERERPLLSQDKKSKLNWPFYDKHKSRATLSPSPRVSKTSNCQKKSEPVSKLDSVTKSRSRSRSRSPTNTNKKEQSISSFDKNEPLVTNQKRTINCTGINVNMPIQTTNQALPSLQVPPVLSNLGSSQKPCPKNTPETVTTTSPPSCSNRMMFNNHPNISSSLSNYNTRKNTSNFNYVQSIEILSGVIFTPENVEINMIKQDYEKNPNFWLDMVSDFYKIKSYDIVKILLDKIIRYASSNKDVVDGHVEINQKIYEIKENQKKSDSVRVFKDCCGRYILLSRISKFLMNYDEAIRIITYGITKFSECTILYLNKAELQHKLLKYAEALETYRTAISLCPTEYLIYSFMADCCFNLKNYRLAVKYYSHYINIDDTCWEVFERRAACYIAAGETKKNMEASKKDIDRALDIKRLMTHPNLETNTKIHLDCLLRHRQNKIKRVYCSGNHDNEIDNSLCWKYNDSDEHLAIGWTNCNSTRVNKIYPVKETIANGKEVQTDVSIQVDQENLFNCESNCGIDHSEFMSELFKQDELMYQNRRNQNPYIPEYELIPRVSVNYHQNCCDLENPSTADLECKTYETMWNESRGYSDLETAVDTDNNSINQSMGNIGNVQFNEMDTLTEAMIIDATMSIKSIAWEMRERELLEQDEIQ